MFKLDIMWQTQQLSPATFSPHEILKDVIKYKKAYFSGLLFWKRKKKSLQTVINCIVVVISAKYIKQFAPVAMVTAHILECLPGSKTFSRHPGGTLVFREPALGLGKKKPKTCRRKTFEGSVSAGLRFLDSWVAQVMENTSNYGVTI